MLLAHHDNVIDVENILRRCGLQETLIADFSGVLARDAVDWLGTVCLQLIETEMPARAMTFLKNSAQVKGRLGYQAEQTGLDSGWSVGMLARLLLLLVTLENTADQREALIREIYRLGGNNEKYLLARGLSILDSEGLLLDMALDMGRTNDNYLLSALVQHNAYPAMFYSEEQFNRLILKALFYDLDISQAINLDKRINTRLVGLCQDFIDEKNDAGRDFTESIFIITKGKRI